MSGKNFASDNITGVAPEIMARLVAENGGDCLPYGDDAYTKTVEAAFNDVFETEVGVMLVATGTASNALALACACPPYGAIFCHREAHIEREEGGSVEHLAGGARLVPLDGENAKLDAKTLDAAISAYSPAATFFRPAAVSITQVTELGTVYSVAEVRAIADVAHRHGLKLHMDGARFANAVASQKCSAAEGVMAGGCRRSLLRRDEERRDGGGGCHVLRQDDARRGGGAAQASRHALVEAPLPRGSMGCVSGRWPLAAAARNPRTSCARVSWAMRLRS